jgi:hypothetical protein
MEAKDAFYIGCLIVSTAVGIGGYLLNRQLLKITQNSQRLNFEGLKLNAENRKNTLRESIFKEQITFFKDLSNRIVAIVYEFDTIFYEHSISESQGNSLAEKIVDLNKFFEANVLLLPNENFFDLIDTITKEADELLEVAENTNGNIPDEKHKKLYDAYAILTDEIWEFMGIEELTLTNHHLIKNKMSGRYANAKSTGVPSHKEKI